jgi:hypothetical protein
MLKWKPRSPAEKKIDEVVETKNGDLKRPILINDRPLTAWQQHEADEQICRLVSNPDALRRSLKEQNDDAAHSQRILKTLPLALIFRFGQQKGDEVELRFSPNPHFRPPTREARAFQAMEGSLWIDSKQQRLMELNGHLTREVKFGGGFVRASKCRRPVSRQTNGGRAGLLGNDAFECGHERQGSFL